MILVAVISREQLTEANLRKNMQSTLRKMVDTSAWWTLPCWGASSTRHLCFCTMTKISRARTLCASCETFSTGCLVLMKSPCHPWTLQTRGWLEYAGLISPEKAFYHWIITSRFGPGSRWGQCGKMLFRQLRESLKNGLHPHSRN